MAGTVKPKKPTPSEKPYNIAGDTLAAIWKDIEKNGPKINGKNRAGKTTADGEAKPNYKYKLKEDKAKGVVTCELWTDVVNVTLLKTKIERPKLKSDKKLSDKAKKEWKRFYKDLMAHEQEHVDAMMDEMKVMGGEVVNITKTAEDADKKKALEKAVADWSTDVLNVIDKPKIVARLKKVNDGLDSKSGHGPTLNTSIP